MFYKFIIAVILFLLEVECSWIAEIHLKTYRNAESKSLTNSFNDDQCCDPPMNDAGQCTDECDNYFNFCLQRLNEIGLESCLYGLYETTEIGGDDLTFEPGTPLDPSTPNPLVFHGEQWPDNSMVKFLTFTYDNDSTGSELVGTAAVSLTITSDGIIRPSSLGSSFYRISMDYSVNCTTNYYGPECSTFCMARDDEGGHYTCDSQGNIMCLLGYTGVNCTIQTNNITCEPQCTGNAHCNVSNRLCECNEGWSGSDCEVPLCEEECPNGGTCVRPNFCQCVNGSECEIAATTSTSTSSSSCCSKDLITSSSIASMQLPRSPTLSTPIGDSSNNGLIIGSVFGAVFIIVIGVLIMAVLIFVANKNNNFPPFSKTRTKSPVIFNPGDNPNYSPTSMGSQPNLLSHAAVDGAVFPHSLDNPTYTNKFNSCTDIVAGYSLVSLAEDQSVYYSSADGPSGSKADEKALYDSIRPTAHNLGRQVYHSQPVLNKEYDYPETRIIKEDLKIKNNNSLCEHYEFDQT